MRQILWVATGVAMLVAGCVVVLTTNGAADFGWFAYTPLEDGVSLTDGVVILSRVHVVALGVALAGLVLIASGVGYIVGQRRGS